MQLPRRSCVKCIISDEVTSRRNWMAFPGSEIFSAGLSCSKHRINNEKYFTTSVPLKFSWRVWAFLQIKRKHTSVLETLMVEIVKRSVNIKRNIHLVARAYRYHIRLTALWQINLFNTFRVIDFTKKIIPSRSGRSSPWNSRFPGLHCTCYLN